MQCCVGFCCAGVIWLYINMHYFSCSFPLWFITGYYLFVYLFVYILFLAVLGLRCGKRGLLFVAVRGLLIAVASVAAEHGL